MQILNLSIIISHLNLQKYNFLYINKNPIKKIKIMNDYVNNIKVAE